MAALPGNRSTIVLDGGEQLLATITQALSQPDAPDLQSFTALLVANLCTRNDENKVRIGAVGTAAPLVDRLSSTHTHVLENVLQAVIKLGSHPGNKVKFGSKVCFEKLLALIHHEDLAIRKGAVSAIAVLIEGNDANKKSLLVGDPAKAVSELCALMKSTNGKIVESAMMILGELSQLADHTLEISQRIDVVVIVRMLEHVNMRIRRAALHTVVNLTKESFNKLRFGIPECVDALLHCVQSEDMFIVELSVTCLANLSFLPSNAILITTAKSSHAIAVLLKLAAASTTSKDYLSWKEAKTTSIG
ncbi:hypothetical protein PINS_up013790 [Pythium insidiosum]|nr:hypothetical protein PINS_up013790 [Pythium insidiosum]